MKKLKDKMKLIKPFYKNDSYIKFDNDNIIFYDNELCMQTSFKSSLDVTLDAATLLSLFDKAGKIDFEIIQKDNQILFRSDTMDILLPTVDVEFPYKEEKVEWNLLPDNFMDALDFCMISISDNLADGLLTCFYVNDYIYSCDNYRITEYKLSSTINYKFLIPSIFYKRIKHINYTKYALTDNSLYLSTDDIVVRTAKVEDEYIDVDLFEIYGAEITEDLVEIKQLVERASFLIPSTKKTREEFVNLNFKNKDITCINKQDKGSSCELFQTFVDYPVISFNVNPHLFSQIADKSNKIIVGDNVLLFIGKNFRHTLCMGEKNN